jgi:hypothetical protein
MRRAWSIATYLLLLEGVAYAVTAAIVLDGRLTIDAVRFIGTGLGWVFLALLNLSAMRSSVRGTVTLALVANSLAALFFLALVIVKTGALSVVALLGILVCLAGSFRTLREPSPSSR